MRDYWLGKFIFDLQQPNMAAAYRENRTAVLDRYPLSGETRSALLADDLDGLIGRVNPYLLRYYFACVGWSDVDFIARLRAFEQQREPSHG